MFAYVGGYTTPDRDGRGNGINVYRIDPATGAWTHRQHIGGLENPSLFTLRRDASRLYAVHGARTLISAFMRDPASGALTLLNQQDCGGSNPVDAALDPAERHLVIGNYGSGTVAVMPLGEDGSLLPVSQSHTLAGTPGPDRAQQSSSHPHAVIFDPHGQFVIVPDKGFDRTFVFRCDAGRITPTAQGSVASRAGAAPRHATFHPKRPILYVNNELDSTVTVFRWHADSGQIDEVQVTSTIPFGFAGRNTTAEIAASPDGRFLYVSNRGEDSIVQFAIDASTGHLRHVATTPTGGVKPRFFTLDPAGASLYAANQDSDDITAFSLDPASGRLMPRGVVVQVGSPSAVSLVAAP
ncbi:MAG: lactonase family protein [Acetobacteraceae bacterium]|nr:lactonase family protein [Acetobacteraceae bacterium]